jgi:hypothetical protein
LHEIEQRVVIELDRARAGRPAFPESARAGIPARICFAAGPH